MNSEELDLTLSSKPNQKDDQNLDYLVALKQMKDREEQFKKDEEFAKKLFLEQELEKGEEKDEYRPSPKDFTQMPQV